MKIKSKSSRWHHFSGVGKVITGIKVGEYKLMLDVKDAGGLLGEKSRPENHN